MVEQRRRLLVDLAGVGLGVVHAARREVRHLHAGHLGDVVVDEVDLVVVDVGVAVGVGGDRDGVVVGGEAQLHAGGQNAFGGTSSAAEEVCGGWAVGGSEHDRVAAVVSVRSARRGPGRCGSIAATTRR